MTGETPSRNRSGVDGCAQVGEEGVVTATPSAVTVKAEPVGWLSNGMFSENWSSIFLPAPITVALVSVGGVVSAATVISKVSLTDPPLPSLAVTFTATVPASAACGVPGALRESLTDALGQLS